MKKIFSICLISLAFACNSGNSKTESTDSSTISVPDAGIKNDVPMRTMDTTTNLMSDTSKMSDTSRPR
ncbi:MAG: hypothetical protein LH478_15750 [Chitinophagaceae bacterium]|nr:hypothetical protein [Chitinophagaceae bacterium]